MSESQSGCDDQVESSPKTEKIKALNDAFRRSFAGGDVMMTLGFQELCPSIQLQAVRAIQSFSNFTDDNDPYGEYDFGEVIIQGVKVWFKIDYYDVDLEGGSPDPSDPSVTKRVMTIFLPEEY